MDEAAERRREIRRWIVVILIFFILVILAAFLNRYMQFAGLGYTTGGTVERETRYVPPSGPYDYDPVKMGPGHAPKATTPPAPPPPAGTAKAPDDQEAAPPAVPSSKGGVNLYRDAMKDEAMALFAQAEERAAGKLVPDEEDVIALYQQAASKGSVDARYRLAVMYATGGEVIPRRVIVAYALYKVASQESAFEGRKRAAADMRELADKMSPDQIQQADALAAKLSGVGGFLPALEKAVLAP